MSPPPGARRPLSGGVDRGEVEERQRQPLTVTKTREHPQHAGRTGGQVARQTQQGATRIPHAVGAGDLVQSQQPPVALQSAALLGCRCSRQQEHETRAPLEQAGLQHELGQTRALEGRERGGERVRGVSLPERGEGQGDAG